MRAVTSMLAGTRDGVLALGTAPATQVGFGRYSSSGGGLCWRCTVQSN